MRFTPEVRKKIYAVVAALVPLLVAVGVLTNDVGSHILNVTAAVLSISASVIAFHNVAPSLPEEHDEVDIEEDKTPY